MPFNPNPSIITIHLSELAAHQQDIAVALGGFLDCADSLKATKLQLMREQCAIMQGELELLQCALCDRDVVPDLEIKYLDEAPLRLVRNG